MEDNTKRKLKQKSKQTLQNATALLRRPKCMCLNVLVPRGGCFGAFRPCRMCHVCFPNACLQMFAETWAATQLQSQKINAIKRILN